MPCISTASRGRLQANAYYGRLPNDVVRDKRLDAAALFNLAYRATFKDFNHRAADMQGLAPSGFGRDVVESSNLDLVALGYLDRRLTRRGPGRGTRVKDTLNLPPCDRRSQRMVWRDWFEHKDQKLKETVAYLYLRAGTGRGPTTLAAEVAERFGWSAPTVAKVIKGLIAADLAASAGGYRETADKGLPDVQDRKTAGGVPALKQRLSLARL